MDRNSSLAEKEDECVWLPDARKLYLLPEISRIFPDGWHRFDFRLRREDGFYRGVYPVIVRTFTALGVNDFTIRITFVSPDEYESGQRAYWKARGVT